LAKQCRSPDDYVHQLSSTTGMPHAMVRRNMQRVASVMDNIPAIVRGLTRGLELSVLDQGFSVENDRPVSFFPRAKALGVVLPSNSPGVHGLWIPAIAMKMPLVLRPGSAEPWTPFRIVQALIKAGVPAEAFNYLPSDHAGAGEIVRQCGRSMFLWRCRRRWRLCRRPTHRAARPRLQQGRARAGPRGLIGRPRSSSWRNQSRTTAADRASTPPGCGRRRTGARIAEAIAARLAAIVPRASDDPRAELAPFVDPKVAVRINQQIEEGLAEPGAEDITARHRTGPRLVEMNGSTYLLPTIVHCSRSDHPLANREFLFPYAAVVDMSPTRWRRSQMPRPTLSLTALTNDQGVIARLLESEFVGRLNLGAIQTNTIAWDQPHEGNLFEHLYARRAFQRAG
jgi:hypothetical protein